MRALVKEHRLTVRFTRAQLALLRDAARRLSRERGELVDESSLARDLIMRGLDMLPRRVARTAA